MAKQTTPKQLALQPLGDRVVIQPVDTTVEKTASGLYIPDSAKKEKPMQGTVVAVGEGKLTDKGVTVPMRVQVGDTVVFSKYGYDELDVDGTQYYILSEAAVLAILK
jgi:chaperonin GroES